MDLYFIIGVLTIFVLLLCVYFSIIGKKKKNNWVSREDFENKKRQFSQNISATTLEEFIYFLRTYKGGYVRRKYGQIVYQDYTAKEKGDLKGIFWNLVFPNPNIDVKKKEEFRQYLNFIGVIGLGERPQYETRDSKLKNRNVGEEYKRKEVGNIGEKIVRDELRTLPKTEYFVINGPKLEFGGITREYDHIVVGQNGVFMIETKAFGMTEGQNTKATLNIDLGDKWTIEKNKNHKEVEAPTEQIISAKQHLENIISDTYLTEVNAILALSNSQIIINGNADPGYDIVKAEDLIPCIKSKRQESILEMDRKMIIVSINNHRKN